MMLDLKRLIWAYLSTNADLLVLVGDASHVKMAAQFDRVPKPGVTIQSSDSNKLVSEVRAIQSVRYMIVAWSSVGDEECERIGDRLFTILDAMSSDANVFVYDSEVSRLAGPYWDEKVKCWRKDISLDIIARER